MDKPKCNQIQTLDGMNFQLLKFHLEIFFRAKCFIDLVNGKLACPADIPENSKGRKTWEEINESSMLLISTAMEFP